MSKSLALVFLFLGGIASAQSSDAARPSSSQPNPEMKRLVEAFSGIWSLTLKMEPDKTSPKGGTGKGEEVWRPGPGGLSMIEDYHSTGDEGEISGLAVIWWDSNAGKYQVTWCDNGSPNGCVVIKHGAKWEGSQLVAMDEWQKDGKKITLKEIFSDITPTSFKQTLYQGESAGELKKFITISAIRK
jgi:hypothetical protein